jgi:type IV secretory pathway VirB2 component (pilin)
MLKTLTNLLKNRTAATVLTVATVSLLSISAAHAGSGGAEFEAMYDQVADWLDGAPGKIGAVLAFGFAMVNVVKQNFIAAMGAFVGCLLTANAKTIIESFLTAGVPL